jgi:hypothetical protein
MNNLRKYKIEDESFEEEESNNSQKLDQSNLKMTYDVKEKENQNKIISPLLPKSKIQQMNHKNAFLDESITSQLTNKMAYNKMENISQMDMLDESNVARDTGYENIEERENFHHPQIIDEDVENFKRRLDITLKNFRTDTMKEFMSIKRHLLVEQKSIVDSEKQKCDALLSSKIDQIEHLKESLAKTKNALTKETEIKEKMGLCLFKLKNTKYIVKFKTAAFTNTIKKYYIRKKKNQTAFNKIRGNLLNKMKLKAFTNIKKNFEEIRVIKLIATKEKEFNDKLNEMSQYYGKEINDLRSKLSEANQTVEKYKESKNQIQENLKKALMRGVVAMNLEAMNVLDDDPDKMNFFDAVNLNNLNHGPSGNNVNMAKIPNNNTLQINNQPTTSYKEERKVVVKDNNWVNACVVPSKMKSNIISHQNEEFEEESESIRPIAHISKQEPPTDYYYELTKSKFFLINFLNEPFRSFEY